MLPLVMEQMPASPHDALSLSRQYVDEADFYVGIFGFRYGYVPEGQEKSITELEYKRAIERTIPTFISLADAKHPVSFDDVETGEGAPKLQAFKSASGRRTLFARSAPPRSYAPKSSAPSLRTVRTTRASCTMSPRSRRRPRPGSTAGTRCSATVLSSARHGSTHTASVRAG